MGIYDPINTTTITLRMATHPEIKQFPSGGEVVTFSAAYNYSVKKNGTYEKMTDWYRVSAWNKLLVKSLMERGAPGVNVTISGTAHPNPYIHKNTGEAACTMNLDAQSLYMHLPPQNSNEQESDASRYDI